MTIGVRPIFWFESQTNHIICRKRQSIKPAQRTRDVYSDFGRYYISAKSQTYIQGDRVSINQA